MARTGRWTLEVMDPPNEATPQMRNVADRRNVMRADPPLWRAADLSAPVTRGAQIGYSGALAAARFCGLGAGQIGATGDGSAPARVGRYA